MTKSFQLTSLMAMVIACGVLSAAHGGARESQSAQAGGAAPAFEVAEIKPDNSGRGGHSQDFDGSRYRAVNVSAKFLIERAYGLTEAQILGAPSWVDSDMYDIDAKMDDDVMAAIDKMTAEQQSEQYKLIFQAFLAERFQLKVSQETRELPTYALVVAKNGPKFKPTVLPPDPTDGSAPTEQQKDRGMDVGRSGRRISLEGNGVQIGRLILAIAPEPDFGGRVLVDETGLKGEYDLKLQWTRERLTAGPAESGAAPKTEDAEPSLFTALDEQLGLKIESRKAQVPVIVIQHIERPSGN
jgi:uncharacterized protein (TIGR03435 family)